jgi:hypothetical protein
VVRREALLELQHGTSGEQYQINKRGIQMKGTYRTLEISEGGLAIVRLGGRGRFYGVIRRRGSYGIYDLASSSEQISGRAYDITNRCARETPGAKF